MGKQQTVTVAGHRLRLTNLDKVLFPVSGSTKAEVIDYWQRVAPALIPHTEHRAVTRKRWPDGVGTADTPKDAFFRKNLEDSAPTWVLRLAQQHEDHVNLYPVITEDDGEALLAWFGQVAALELHVPQWRFPSSRKPVTGRAKEPKPAEPQNPDRLVLDLDPGEGVGLAECAQVACWCREILDEMGLPSVPVTSGSKGVHLYAALEGSTDSAQVSEVAKELARALEKDHPDEVLSSMSRSERAGKVFIDWSQNNRNKTTVAPYSLRGRPGAESGPFVAAPRTWEEMERTDSLGQLTTGEVLQRLEDGVDPMVDLRPSVPETDASVPQTEGASRKDRLTAYRSKRDASKTAEPVPENPPEAREGERIFVIQEHHARRLHYDTRLEHEGVLVSWAVPKAPPLRQGTQRLAVQTEDHPMEYAEFEGRIPKGEYGAGEVGIWDSGTVEVEKWEDGKVVAVLHGRSDGGLGGKPRRYALIRTDEDKNWIIRLTKEQPGKASRGRGKAGRRSEESRSAAARRAGSSPASAAAIPSPMLATLGEPKDIRGSGWIFEGKWDGYRVLAKVDDGAADDDPQVELRSRSGKELTGTFPELSELADLVPEGTVLDGEVVALNSNSRPDFGLLQKRGRLTKKREIEQAAKKIPVHYMLFDVLHTAEHGEVTGRPCAERREILADLVTEGDHVKAPGDLGGSLEEALQISEELMLEGILCKRADSRYRAGRRSGDWIKIKHEDHADVTIIGWRQGRGSRASTFGSLLLAVEGDDGGLRYAGRVGTGFSQAELEELRGQLERMQRKTPPVGDVPDEDASDATWVTPKVQAEVQHSGVTRDHRLRQPRWRRMI